MIGKVLSIRFNDSQVTLVKVYVTKQHAPYNQLGKKL